MTALAAQATVSKRAIIANCGVEFSAHCQTETVIQTV